MKINKRKKNYLGIATTPHDPALAIINSEGDLVFAESTERYLQNKRAWNALPIDIIRVEKLLKKYCDENVDFVIASSWSRKFINPIGYKINQFLSKILRKKTDLLDFYSCLKNLYFCHHQSKDNLYHRIREKDISAKIYEKQYNHHLSHAASACYCSPFKEAICIIIDGFGECTTISVFSYDKAQLKIIPKIKKSTGSLGLFYDFLCDLCGFDFLKGEQWKVMGLASYGKYDNTLYKDLRPLIEVDNCCLKTAMSNKGKIKSKIIHKIGNKPDKNYLRFADLAYTGQYIFCETVIELLNNIHKLRLSNNLILSGGCALNSSCNGIILEKTKFKNLYVPSSPGDDGNAIGAALLAYYEDNPANVSPAKLKTPYLGEQVSKKTIKNLKDFGNLKCLSFSEDILICKKAAQLLSEGKIIGWVQGKAEFGPRALGNRSILADARSSDVKNRLNAEVKFREEFRPFAPSILHEHGENYFINYQESPYMERTLYFKKEVIKKIPGVVHIDGTGRLQTVKQEWNKKFYDLITEFYKITGIPLILNTSFNVMGKPIVHSVEDAIAVFFTSGLDVLIIGNDLYQK